MEPKSIVFLVDGSGSIFGESNRLLKETVKNVSNLVDVDFVHFAIVKFSKRGSREVRNFILECHGA